MRVTRTGVVSGAVVLVLLAGCSADATPTPTTAPSGSAEAEEPQWTVESLAEAVLESDVLGAEPVAGTSGTVASAKGDWDVQVDVLSVTADAQGTDLVYVLRSTDDGVTDVDRRPWGDGRDIWNDTRSIVVVDAGGERLLPYTGYTAGDTTSDDFCACSQMPMSIGEGDVLAALLPPLAEGTTEVTIEFPGLEPLVAVPVTRS